MYPTLFPPLDSQDSATRNTVNLNTLLLFQTKEKSILLANFKAGKVHKHLFTPCGLVWSTFTRALLWEVAKPYWPVLYHSLMWKKWSRSVVSNSLRPHGLWPTRLLCPWNSPPYYRQVLFLIHSCNSTNKPCYNTHLTGEETVRENTQKWSESSTSQGGFAYEFVFSVSTCMPSGVRMLHDAKSTSGRTIQS